MHGLFKPAVFVDPRLGEFTRSRALWRGALRIGSGSVASLVICGSRSAPDTRALQHARAVAADLAGWQTSQEAALFDHYRPYAEAVAAGALVPLEPFPEIGEPSAVWPHVSLRFIAITEHGGAFTTELGYAVAWDGEHILGARFRGGAFVELRGSVREP